MKPVLNRRYELTGNEMVRILKISAIGKCVPIGNLRGGPGGRCLFVLTLLHYFGYWGYLCKVKYAHRIGFIKPVLRRLKK